MFSPFLKAVLHIKLSKCPPVEFTNPVCILGYTVGFKTVICERPFGCKRNSKVLIRSQMPPTVWPVMERKMLTRMGVRGPVPHQINVIGVHRFSLVLPASSRRLLCHTFVRLRPLTPLDV